jgi:hypothetical protein
MAPVFALALAAAVYPQLLAVVVVILTRERPKQLLLTCWLASMAVSIGAGIAIVAVFRSRATVAGTSSSRLGPSDFLVIGALALVVATVVGTERGRELFGRAQGHLRWYRKAVRAESAPAGGRSRAERVLSDGSRLIAAGVGALLAVPGPFDLLALGHLIRTGATWGVMIVMVVVVNLIKFVLIEVPLVAYWIWPERTTATVQRFAEWMKARKFEVTAVVVGVVGLVFVGKGIVGIA